MFCDVEWDESLCFSKLENDEMILYPVRANTYTCVSTTLEHLFYWVVPLLLLRLSRQDCLLGVTFVEECGTKGGGCV